MTCSCVLFLKKKFNCYFNCFLQRYTTERQKTLHYRLPYIGHFSHKTKIKLKNIWKRFCKEIDISTPFSLLKISSFFSCKHTLPKSLQSFLVYQFTCAWSKAYFIGEAKRHLSTRTEEHLGGDKKFFSHLQENLQCQEKVNFDCFKIIYIWRVSKNQKSALSHWLVLK